MIILVLFAAVIFYTVIYVLYNNSQSSMGQAISLMSSLEQAALAPQHTVFVILRGLILATFLYVIADFLISSARGAKRKRDRKSEDEEPPVLKLKDPSMR